MWGRLSSLAHNPNIASFTQLTKDGIGQLSRITSEVLAEVKAVESSKHDEDGKDGHGADEGDGWFGDSDLEEAEEEEPQQPERISSAAEQRGDDGDDGQQQLQHDERADEEEKVEHNGEYDEVPLDTQHSVELDTAEGPSSSQQPPASHTPPRPVAAAPRPPPPVAMPPPHSNALLSKSSSSRPPSSSSSSSSPPRSQPLSVSSPTSPTRPSDHVLQNLQQQVAALTTQLSRERDNVRREESERTAVNHALLALGEKLDDEQRRHEQTRQQVDDERQAWQEEHEAERVEHDRALSALRAEQERIAQDLEELRLQYQQLQVESTSEQHEQQEAMDALRTGLEGKDQQLEQLTAQLSEQRAQAEEERRSLVQQLSAAQIASSSSPSPSPSASGSGVDQSSIIAQLHSTVEKLRRIIHKLTTERNDALTVMMSVHNGLTSFAERNQITVSGDDEEPRGAEDDEKQAGSRAKDSDDDKRRKLQTLVDRLLVALQQRLSQPAPASSVSSSATALHSQLAALQAAYDDERVEREAQEAEVERLYRIKDEMVSWKEKASQLMAKMKDDKDKREKTLAAKMKEQDDEHDAELELLRHDMQQKDSTITSLQDTVARLTQQLETAQAAPADSLEDGAESLREVQEALEEERRRAQVAEERAAALEAELPQLSSSLTQLTAEKQQLHSERHQLSSELHAVRTALQVAKTEAAAREAGMEQDARTQRERVVELERVLQQERDITERGWEERDEHWKAREDDYAAERERYVQQLDEAEKRATELEQQVRAETAAQREVLETKLKALSKQLEEERKRDKRERMLLDGKLRQLMEEREQERKEKEDELQQVRAGGADRRKYEEQLAEKDRTIAALRDERNREHSAHLHAIKAMQDDRTDVLQQHEQLRQQWQATEAELQEQLTERQAELQSVQADLGRWQQRVEEEDAEIAALQVRCADAEKGSERMKAHLKDTSAFIRSQYEEAVREMERMTAELDGYRQQEEKTRAVSELCESLSFQLEQKEAECLANVDALNNLQLVLEALQAEQDAAKAALQADLDALRDETQRGRDAQQHLDQAQTTIGFLQSSLSSVRAELLDAQNALAFGAAETEKLRAGFQSTVDRLKLFSSDENLIDRRLVVKMFVTFFERGQKDDVLQLMYRVLGLTDEERQRVERGRKGKGIGGRLYGLTSYVSVLNPFDSGASTPALNVEDASLADLWVDFLLKETEQATQANMAKQQLAAVEAVPAAAADSGVDSGVVEAARVADGIPSSTGQTEQGYSASSSAAGVSPESVAPTSS